MVRTARTPSHLRHEIERFSVADALPDVDRASVGELLSGPDPDPESGNDESGAGVERRQRVDWRDLYLRLPADQHARLLAYAARRGRPVVEVLRSWLTPIIASLPSETTNAA